MNTTQTGSNAIMVTESVPWVPWPDVSKCVQLHDAIEWLSRNHGIIEFAEWPDMPPYVFVRVICDDGSCAGTTEPFHLGSDWIQAVVDAVKAAHDMKDDQDKLIP